ncbi:MAG TPA: hypothetical protein VIR79_03095 [Nitrospira sp.]
MTRPQLFTAAFFALLLLLLSQIVLMFKPFLFLVLWAALLAHITFPLHNRLTQLVGGWRDAGMGDRCRVDGRSSAQTLADRTGRANSRGVSRVERAGGLALYGLIGLFIGPIIVSLLITALDIYREEYYEAGLAPPGGPATSA